jgi:hypothetical protein
VTKLPDLTVRFYTCKVVPQKETVLRTVSLLIVGTGFRSVVENRAPVPRFATTAITPWQTALKCTAVYHNKTNP